MSVTLPPPKGWTRRRMRFDIRVNPLKSKLDLPPDTEVSFVPMDDVGELGGLDLNETRLLADVYKGYTYFSDSDVCIAKITPCFENRKGALANGLTNGIAFGTTELHVIRPLEHLDAKFLFYLTIADDFRSFGEAEMLGAGGQKRVPEDFIKDWATSIPPLRTQHRIAQFLDEKTARIDGLIEKKRALLDRLAEKRQALITRAVTKGLNPDASMKPSGIAWLGDVPAHWGCKRLRFTMLTNPSKREIKLKDDELVSFVPMEAVGEYGGLNLETEKELADVADGYTYFADNDVVIAKITPCFENGKGAIASGLKNGVAFGTTELHVMRGDENLLTEYLFYICMSHPFAKIGGSEMYGAGGQKRVPERYLKDFRIGLPSTDEQIEIIEYINRVNGNSDLQAEKTLESVNKLAEYRAAIITSAVTGQIGGLQ